MANQIAIDGAAVRFFSSVTLTYHRSEESVAFICELLCMKSLVLFTFPSAVFNAATWQANRTSCIRNILGTVPVPESCQKTVLHLERVAVQKLLLF